MITFSLSPYSLRFLLDPFLCTCFAFWIILGGVRGCYFRVVGREKETSHSPPYRKDMRYTGEAQQEALLFCARRKWIPTTPQLSI